MSQITKNQHYIPRCVLKHFANAKGQIQELLITEDRVFPTRYAYSMTENYTYEHPELDTNFLENEFCGLEDIFAPKVAEIIRILECNEAIVNDIKQRIEEIINTVIIFYYRSGALLHELSFLQREKHDRITLMLDNILRSTYINNLSSTITRCYSFSVIKSEKGDFLLSDQYVSTAALKIKGRFIDLSNRHMGLRDVIILIPISSKFYIAYYNGNVPSFIKKDKVNILSEPQVEEINKVIINNSYVKCVSLNNESIERAKENFSFASPASTTMGFNSGAVTGATLKKEVFFYDSDHELWDFFLSHRWPRYNNLGRNDLCGCGSEKKFKNCCFNLYQCASRIMDDIIASQKNPNFFHYRFKVHPEAIIERPVAQFHNKNR